jgi:hypothetical protein
MRFNVGSRSVFAVAAPVAALAAISLRATGRSG